MWLKAEKAKIGHAYFISFQGYEKTCGECSLRKRCLRKEGQGVSQLDFEHNQAG
jgi:uncharacterized protein (UPF0179 family)